LFCYNNTIGISFYPNKHTNLKHEMVDNSHRIFTNSGKRNYSHYLAYINSVSVLSSHTKHLRLDRNLGRGNLFRINLGRSIGFLSSKEMKIVKKDARYWRTF
jgi:hypothetical protein